MKSIDWTIIWGKMEYKSKNTEAKKSLGLSSWSSVFVLLWQKQTLTVEFKDKKAGKAPVNKYHSIMYFYPALNSKNKQTSSNAQGYFREYAIIPKQL